MRTHYIFTDPDGWSFTIKPDFNGDGVAVMTLNGVGVSINLPAAERQAAAQALAGDEWRVVSAKQPGPPPTINPADVKVGDVVEVEGADGAWLVRGEVDMIDEPGTDYLLCIRVDYDHGAAIWPCIPGNTVRLVRRAVPDPDPEQVEALYQMLADLHPLTTEKTLRESARELIRRGVTVRKDT